MNNWQKRLKISYWKIGVFVYVTFIYILCCFRGSTIKVSLFLSLHIILSFVLFP